MTTWNQVVGHLAYHMADCMGGRANLRCVWFSCCVTVKDRFHEVSGLSKIEHCVP